jgi:hypothetical protein
MCMHKHHNTPTGSTRVALDSVGEEHNGQDRQAAVTRSGRAASGPVGQRCWCGIRAFADPDSEWRRVTWKGLAGFADWPGSGSDPLNQAAVTSGQAGWGGTAWGPGLCRAHSRALRVVNGSGGVRVVTVMVRPAWSAPAATRRSASARQRCPPKPRPGTGQGRSAPRCAVRAQPPVQTQGARCTPAWMSPSPWAAGSRPDTRPPQPTGPPAPPRWNRCSKVKVRRSRAARASAHRETDLCSRPRADTSSSRRAAAQARCEEGRHRGSTERGKRNAPKLAAATLSLPTVALSAEHTARQNAPRVLCAQRPCRHESQRQPGRTQREHARSMAPHAQALHHHGDVHCRLQGQCGSGGRVNALPGRHWRAGRQQLSHAADLAAQKAHRGRCSR